MNDFAKDDRWQRSVRDEVLVPYYERIAFGGRFVFLDKTRLDERLIANVLQRQMSIDTVVQVGPHEFIGVQEKIVRYKGRKYTATCLETDSCTVPGHESQGWMHHGITDRLLYCMETFEGDLSCLNIEFAPLRVWFWAHESEFATFQMETQNRSAGRVVPIDAIAQAVPMDRFWLPRPRTRQVGATQ